MSDLGKTVEDIRKQGAWKALTISPRRSPIGIKTPLEKGNSQGETLFKMNFDIIAQIQDNLKNLIMTQRGERLGFPDYGTSLRAIYSNTTADGDKIAEYASEEIKRAVSKYMPNIELVQFYTERVESSEVKNDYANILGLDLANLQNNISIQDASLTEVNKHNPSLDSLYKITIDYNIPLLGKNETRTIKLYINNSK
jgi:phage baseplate assembly protein W